MKIATPRLPCLAQAFLRSSSGWPSNSQCSVMEFTYCCELHVSQERTLLICEDVQGRGRPCPVLPDPLRVRIPLSSRGFFPGVSRGFYSPLWDMPECFWTDWIFLCFSPRPSLPLEAGTGLQLLCCRPRDKADSRDHGIVPSMHPSFSFLPDSFAVSFLALESPDCVTGHHCLQLMLSTGSFSRYLPKAVRP